MTVPSASETFSGKDISHSGDVSAGSVLGGRVSIDIAPSATKKCVLARGSLVVI